MKPRIADLFGRTALLLLVSASAAGAQLANGKWTLSPQTSSGRRAVERPQTQTVIVLPQAPVYYNPGYPRYPVAYTVLPAVVMSDGSIFADFGYGYELVSRPCAPVAPVVVTGAPTVIAGNGQVISGSSQHGGLPVSQGNSFSSRGPTVVVSSASQYACYARDGRGGMFVYF